MQITLSLHCNLILAWKYAGSAFGPDYAHHQGTAFGFYASGFGSDSDEELQAEPGSYHLSSTFTYKMKALLIVHVMSNKEHACTNGRCRIYVYTDAIPAIFFFSFPMCT